LVIIHDFGLTPAEYREKFKSLEIPRPEKCPKCQACKSFHRHGVYWRYVVHLACHERVPVCRYRCRKCRHTLSVLPAFTVPRFQYAVSVILASLSAVCQAGLPAQCFRFWQRRFCRNLTRIELFFRDYGFTDIIPKNRKEKAIKLLCMVRTFPKVETFSQTFHNHCNISFMAR